MSESFNTLFSLNERSQKLNKKSRLVFLNNLITISSSKIFGNTDDHWEKNVDIRKKMEFLIELESELNVKRKLRTTINVNKEIISVYTNNGIEFWKRVRIFQYPRSSNPDTIEINIRFAIIHI